MLRSFANNPLLGGFGGESQLATELSQTVGIRQDDNDIEKSTNTNNYTNDNTQDGVGSCDAFVQILKELVDNAVDACVSSNEKVNGDDKDNTTMKRVRVKITSESVPVASKMMNCLRLEVSDNGCGMEDIDECVSAFSSNKQQTKDTSNDNDVGEKGSEMQSTINGKKQSSSNNNGNTENYTSGRYGVGLTLCILHAQRLVPGTGASITSATASSNQWTRAVYEPDTSADSIVCKKREQFPKHSENESGTTISLLVPVSTSLYLLSSSVTCIYLWLTFCF